MLTTWPDSCHTHWHGSEKPFTAPCRDDDSDEFYDRTAGKAKLKRAKAQEPALDAATLYGKKVGSLHSAHLICKDTSALFGPAGLNSGEAIPACSSVHHWLLQARCKALSAWWLQASTVSLPCSLLTHLHPSCERVKCRVQVQLQTQ